MVKPPVYRLTKRCDQDSHGVSDGVREGKGACFFRVNEVAEVNKTRVSAKSMVKRVFSSD
jgi:hypothetical protein